MIGAPIPSRAQDTNRIFPRPPRRNLPGPPVPGRVMESLAPMLGILTPEQRDSLHRAMQAEGEKVRDLDIKLRHARRELFEAGLKGEFNETDVRAIAMAAANAEAELSVLRVKAFSRITPPLSPEQLEEIGRRENVMFGPRGGVRRPEFGRPAPIPPHTNRDINDLPPKP
jgi:hypothetical protein